MIDLKRQPPTEWRHARIPKKTPGEYRYLIIPNDELKAVQKDILNTLYQCYETWPARNAHGFVPGRNTSTGAAMHLKDSPCIISIDVKDFFPSFPVDKIRDALLKNDFFKPSEVAYILKYCVYTDKNGKQQCPQGAPTSPYLTNIGMRELDFKIRSFAEAKGYTYSRYADDITFAADYTNPVYNPDVKSHRFLIEGTRVLLKTYGLQINNKKLSVVYKNSPRAARRITGINLRQDGHGYNAKPCTRHKGRALCHILWRKLQDGADPKSLLGDYAVVRGFEMYCNQIRKGSDEGFNGPDTRLNLKKLAYIKERMAPYVGKH